MLADLMSGIDVSGNDSMIKASTQEPDMQTAAPTYERGEFDIDGNPVICTYVTGSPYNAIACRLDLNSKQISIKNRAPELSEAEVDAHLSVWARRWE